jgi:hypothetical protein
MQNGYPEANQLVSIVFITIISTVAIYGLSASWVARKLGVAKPVPRGFLIIGAHDWALDIAKSIQEKDIKVMVADSNWKNISNAKSRELDTYYGNVLSEFALDYINLDGLGKLLSMTPNDEVNALTALRFAEVFGRSHVYQLSPNSKKGDQQNDVTTHLTGRTLFKKEMTFDHITDLYEEGKVIKSTLLTETFTFQNFKDTYSDEAIPLFLVTKDGSVQPFVIDNPPTPQDGDTLISLANPEADKERKPAKTTEEQAESN